MEIIDNPEMPGANYAVGAYCLYRNIIRFDESGKPIVWGTTDVRTLRIQGNFAGAPASTYQEIAIDTATPKQLLEIQEKLKMYSEPWDYFAVETKDDSSSNQE